MITGERSTLNGGIDVEILKQGGKFLGIGAVRMAGVPVRSGRRPMFVEIRNPNGIELCDYEVLSTQASPDLLRVNFKMNRREGGLMEWMLHEVRPVYSTRDWSLPPAPAQDTVLSLEIRPISRQIGGRAYHGISYQYHYQSKTIPIYKILDRGTWEIGGQAVGNEFWMRNCFVPPIMPIESVEQHHSTEWYLPSARNPNVVQFLPLQTELQGFSFTASPAGILVTLATKCAHLRSLFEKQRGSDEIVHFHEHCDDLGLTLSTSPIEVLFYPGPSTKVERANAYEHVAEFVRDALHQDAGFRRERVTTYGQIEEWGNADLRRYREKGLPRLLEAGARCIYLANHFQNNMNVWGVSNMCCTVDYKVAASVGEKNLRDFCRAARAGGAEVEMWGNTAVSTLSVLFHRRSGAPGGIQFQPKENSIMERIGGKESTFVRTPTGAMEADHYSPEFAVLNLRSPDVQNYWFQAWKRAYTDIGITGIFLDSSFNLSSDKFHFALNSTHGALNGATPDQTHLLGHQRPASEPAGIIHSQYKAHLELIRSMQEMGYHYCNEDLGVFGVHRHGPEAVNRLDNLFLWTDCIVWFDSKAIRTAGTDPDEIFFQGLAYRMMWSISWDPAAETLSFNPYTVRGEFDIPRPWHLELLKLYVSIERDMRNRQILPGESGVSYDTDEGQIIWCFADQTCKWADPMWIQDLIAGTSTELKTFNIHARHVYRIRRPQNQPLSNPDQLKKKNLRPTPSLCVAPV